MAKTQRGFTREFKVEAIKPVTEKDCSVAEAARSLGNAQQRRDALLVKIRTILAECKQRYGSPHVHAELQGEGIDCRVNTVAKLMRDNDVGAKTTQKLLGKFLPSVARKMPQSPSR